MAGTVFGVLSFRDIQIDPVYGFFGSLVAQGPDVDTGASNAIFNQERTNRKSP
jgi:hypothetical protein